MYSNLAFAISLLGLFSIFELLKGSQKISLIKYHFIARLILLSAGSFFDYLELAGAKMKTTTRWINPTNAYKGAGTTNESGFSGLPGICREESGKFITYIGQVGYWWTASDYSTSNAYYRLLSYDTDNFLKGNENKKRGFSVRCIRD